MTLEESNKQALAAAQAGDLETLADALNARRQAIAELHRQAPSVELAARMRDALRVGDVIADALFRWKQRLGAESGRLARIAETVTVGCGVERS